MAVRIGQPSIVVTMNGDKHFLIGLTAGVLGYSALKFITKEPIKIDRMLYSGVIGAFASILPDVIEPASSPNHRSFFHSVTFLALLVGANRNIEFINDPAIKEAIIAISTGYASHLLADASTPKGIPLLT